MDSYKWFLLGIMAAWTPGMILLALMLMRDVVFQTGTVEERSEERSDKQRIH
jgi:hypothetical protein